MGTRMYPTVSDMPIFGWGKCYTDSRLVVYYSSWWNMTRAKSPSVLPKLNFDYVLEMLMLLGSTMSPLAPLGR